MTDNMRDTYARLREVHEREDTDTEGVVWGVVYLDNVGQDRHLAGTLGALAKVGLYKFCNDPQFRNYFGYVRLRAGAQPRPESPPCGAEEEEEEVG